MFEFLKSHQFNYVFSFLVGLGIVSLFQSSCKGDACRILRAPPYEELQQSTYQLSKDCYKFHAAVIDCPNVGVIEPFERFVR